MFVAPGVSPEIGNAKDASSASAKRQPQSKAWHVRRCTAWRRDILRPLRNENRSAPSAFRGSFGQQSTGPGKDFITGNQFDIAGFDFSSSSFHFGKLRFGNLRRHVFGQTTNQSFRQFSANFGRERHRFTKDFFGCSHVSRVKKAARSRQWIER